VAKLLLVVAAADAAAAAAASASVRGANRAVRAQVFLGVLIALLVSVSLFLPTALLAPHAAPAAVTARARAPAARAAAGLPAAAVAGMRVGASALGLASLAAAWCARAREPYSPARPKQVQCPPAQRPSARPRAEARARRGWLLGTKIFVQHFLRRIFDAAGAEERGRCPPLSLSPTPSHLPRPPRR
jgi:hypothetical protein